MFQGGVPIKVHCTIYFHIYGNTWRFNIIFIYVYLPYLFRCFLFKFCALQILRLRWQSLVYSFKSFIYPCGTKFLKGNVGDRWNRSRAIAVIVSNFNRSAIVTIFFPVSLYLWVEVIVLLPKYSFLVKKLILLYGMFYQFEVMKSFVPFCYQLYLFLFLFIVFIVYFYLLVDEWQFLPFVLQQYSSVCFIYFYLMLF